MAKIEVSDELKEKVDRKGLNFSMLINRLLKSMEEEERAVNWAVKLQKSSRKGRYEELKEKGLV